MKRYDLYKRSIHDTANMAIRKTGGWVEYSEAKGIISNLTQGVTVLTNRIITLEADNKEMLEALKHLEEYWNRDRNDEAMHDALWDMIKTIEPLINKIEANNG